MTSLCGRQHQQALKFFQESRYKEAVQVLDQVLKSLETSEIWNDWATAQLMCNRLVESEQGYRRALWIDPRNTSAAGNLGVLLARTGRLTEALPFLKGAAGRSSGRERDALLRLVRTCRGEESGQNQATTTLMPGHLTAQRDAGSATVVSSHAHCAQAGIYFKGFVYGGSGYAEEAWVEALGVSECGIPVQLAPLGPATDTSNLLPIESRHKLEALQRRAVDLSQSIFLQYSMASAWDMEIYGRWCVVRTMFETDRLPDGVRERCNRMDEVWVPTRFNLETYARAGVEEKKLRLVPPGVDTQLFRPGAMPLQIPRKRGFNFISIFDWQLRKGYDILLLAYLREFKPDEDVALILKVSQLHDAFTDLQGHITWFVEREAGLRLENAPPIILINGYIPQREMPRLYATGDCFVLPTRGEGYGRPFMEALSCQIPVIATGWSGQADFLSHENSYLIDYSVAPVPEDVDVEIFAGHRWAEPDVDHLRQLMRQIFSHREEARQRAEQGRACMVQQYDWKVIIPRWVAESRRLLD